MPEPEIGLSTQKPRSFFYKFSLFFLSAEWIIFGSLHFSFHRLTVAEMPARFPLKDFAANLSGMLEVTAGMLILVSEPKVRKFAAILSLALLFVLLPAMYNIISADSATEGMHWLADPFRAVLMPNNILMAICSVYVLRDLSLDVPTPSIKMAQNPAAPKGVTSRLPVRTSALVVGLILLASNCAGFLTIRAGGFGAMAYIWAMMCMALGAIIGFLFGVPKVNARYKSRANLQTNSNIDAVSDWLTKILVGVGLINFDNIGKFIDSHSLELARSLSPNSDPSVNHAFAEALILFFFAAGLIEGYLMTRLYLGPEFGDNLL